jgi:hypothetical protein
VAWPISHTDVTTTMSLIADIAADIRDLRDAFVEEDENGEEEDPEADG